MNVTVHLPEAVAQALGATADEVERRLLEQAAVEAYRAGSISRAQVRQALGLSWHATEALLARHGCLRNLGPEEFEQDGTAIQHFLASR